MAPGILGELIDDILCGGPQFLEGIHKSSSDSTKLVTAVVQWAQLLNRTLGEVVAGIEPCVRQSILMSLIPAKAIDPSYVGSTDRAITEHLAAIGLDLGSAQIKVLRDLCLNARRMHGLDARQAKNISATIAHLKGMPGQYETLNARQNGRCRWCGVELRGKNTAETLDHVVPKHLGNDLADGSNWALSCFTCNMGKGDSLAWAARQSAHDYMTRIGFGELAKLDREHRWAVLMRGRECDECTAGVTEAELWVYRRVSTGLPIPANCSVTCLRCGTRRGLEILEPAWAPGEEGRTLLKTR